MKIKLLFMGIVLSALVSHLPTAKSEDQKVTVEPLDPHTPIADVLSKGGNDCHIIIQDGKPYRVCPFLVPLAIQDLIKSQQSK